MIWNIVTFSSNHILLHRIHKNVTYSLKYEIILGAYDATSKYMIIRSSSKLSDLFNGEILKKAHTLLLFYFFCSLKRYTLINPGHNTKIC